MYNLYDVSSHIVSTPIDCPVCARQFYCEKILLIILLSINLCQVKSRRHIKQSRSLDASYISNINFVNPFLSLKSVEFLNFSPSLLVCCFLDFRLKGKLMIRRLHLLLNVMNRMQEKTENQILNPQRSNNRLRVQ